MVTTEDILLVAAFCIALSVIPIVFQVVLSTRDTKWYGWILPGITFLVSLNATYASFTQTLSDGAGFGRVFVVFAVFNMLTVALCITYYICRNTEKRREADAVRKKQKEEARAAKDAARETIELK